MSQIKFFILKFASLLYFVTALRKVTIALDDIANLFHNVSLKDWNPVCQMDGRTYLHYITIHSNQHTDSVYVYPTLRERLVITQKEEF